MDENKSRQVKSDNIINKINKPAVIIIAAVLLFSLAVYLYVSISSNKTTVAVLDYYDTDNILNGNSISSETSIYETEEYSNEESEPDDQSDDFASYYSGTSRTYKNYSNNSKPQSGLPSTSSKSNSNSSKISSSSKTSDKKNSSSSSKTNPSTTIPQVDINTATLSELKAVLPVNQIICNRIIEYRELYGPYESLEDLKNVDGIGEYIYEKLLPYIKLENADNNES